MKKGEMTEQDKPSVEQDEQEPVVEEDEQEPVVEDEDMLPTSTPTSTLLARARPVRSKFTKRLK
ncbi:MAG: hypothetical protein ABII10_02495 [Candidatus Paceibacterota bacterium]